MSTLSEWRKSQPPPKSRRHRAGVRNPYLSQTEAAKLIGVHVSTFRAWEKGRVALPDYVKEMIR